MCMPAFAGLIFDLDGTLLDSTSVWDAVDREFLARRGLEVPADYAQAVSALSFDEAAAYTVQRFGLGESPAHVVAEWHAMVRLAYERQLLLKPGAKAFLHAQRAWGAKLALATASCEALYAPALRRAGVYGWFDAFVTSDEVARGKGWPDIYLEAARRMGLAAKECAVFEDLPAGVRGAKAGGFYTVAVYDAASAAFWPQLCEQADSAVRGWQELL